MKRLLAIASREDAVRVIRETYQPMIDYRIKHGKGSPELYARWCAAWRVIDACRPSDELTYKKEEFRPRHNFIADTGHEETKIRQVEQPVWDPIPPTIRLVMPHTVPRPIVLRPHSPGL